MARKSKIDKKIAELKRLEKQRKERERRTKISRTKKKNISIKEIPQQIGRRAQANVIIVGGARSDVGKKRKPKTFAEKKNREIQSTGIQDYAQLRGQRRVASDKLGYETQTKDPLALSRGGGRYLRDASDTEATRRYGGGGRTGSEEVVRRENQNFAARLSALEAEQSRDIRLGEATSRARKKGLMDRFLQDSLFSDTDSSSISTRSSLSDSTSFYSQSTTPSDRRRRQASVAEARRPSTAPEPAPAPAPSQPPEETGRGGTKRFTDPAFQRAIRGTELKTHSRYKYTPDPVPEQQRLIFPKLPDPSPAREGAPQPPPLVFDESQEERRQEALKEFQQVPEPPPRQVQVDTSISEIDREIRRGIDEDMDEDVDDEGFDTAEEDPNIEADRLVRRASPQLPQLQPQTPPPSLPTFESEFGELGRRARRIAEERKKPLRERRMTAKPELTKRTSRTQIEQLTDDLMASARDPNRRQGLSVQVVEVPTRTAEEQARVKKEIEDKKKARDKEREREIEDRILAQNLSRDIVSRASRRDTQRRGIAREALQDIMSGAERRGLARRTARDIVSGALRREEIDRRREEEEKANIRPVVEGEGRSPKPKRKKGRPRTPRRRLMDRKKELMEELSNFGLYGRGDLRGIGTTPQRLNIIIELARGRLNQQGLPELFPEVEQKIREIHNLTKQIG